MPQEARNRLQLTLERIINEGCDGLITSAEAARQCPRFEIEFTDGRIPARPDSAPKSRKPEPPEQKSLF